MENTKLSHLENTILFFLIIGLIPSFKQVNNTLLGKSNEINLDEFKKSLFKTIRKIKKENIEANETDQKTQDLLLKKVNKWQFIFKYIPYIRYVGICNSLSMGNVTDESDIDLLIISKSNKLFTTRMFTTFILHFLRLRRHDKYISKRFCLSFFITEDALQFSKLAIDNDVYLKFWLKCLQPVYIHEDFNENFYTANEKWLRHDFVNPKLQRIKKEKSSGLTALVERILSTKVGRTLESILMGIQMKRISKKKNKLSNSGGTIISKNILKFHDNDIRLEVSTQWQKLKSKTKKIT